MKKLIILIAAFLFIYQTSHAQTEKGNQTFGIDLGGLFYEQNQLSIDPYDQSSSINNTTYSSFDIGPNYSYFIADKLDLGVSLSYSSSSANYNSTDISATNKSVIRDYGASVYLRKYFMYSSKIGIRTGPYIEYYKENQKITYPGANSVDNLNSNSNIYEAGISLDLVYYPTKHLGIAATLANLDYQHTGTNNGDQGNGHADYLNFSYINDGLSLSVFYVFGSKK